MIVALIVALTTGLAAGAISDELLRGRDPRSNAVIVAGVVGGLAGFLAHRAMGSDGLLLGTLAALVGSLIVAFIVRVRMSAAIGRLRVG